MSEPKPIPQTWDDIPKRICKQHFSAVHVSEDGKLHTVEFMLQNPDRKMTGHTVRWCRNPFDGSKSYAT